MKKLVIDITHEVFVAENGEFLLTTDNNALFIEFYLASEAIVPPLREGHFAHFVFNLEVKHL